MVAMEKFTEAKKLEMLKKLEMVAKERDMAAKNYG
jgi:hypothetical protein